MQAALETRLYQKEKNKHRQNDPKKVGRGQRPKKEQRNSDSHSESIWISCLSSDDSVELVTKEAMGEGRPVEVSPVIHLKSFPFPFSCLE